MAWQPVNVRGRRLRADVTVATARYAKGRDVLIVAVSDSLNQSLRIEAGKTVEVLFDADTNRLALRRSRDRGGVLASSAKCSRRWRVSVRFDVLPVKLHEKQPAIEPDWEIEEIGGEKSLVVTLPPSFVATLQ